jgi:hypothetical protein
MDTNCIEYISLCGKCGPKSGNRKRCNLCVCTEDWIWRPDNNILLDDKEIVREMLTSDYFYNSERLKYDNIYKYFSERLKYDLEICRTVVERDSNHFKYLPDKIKNDINFIKSIYQYLPQSIKKIIKNIHPTVFI